MDYVEPSQNTISLKMIPRIDLDRIKAKMSLVGPSDLQLTFRFLSCRQNQRFIFIFFFSSRLTLQKDWFAKRKKFKRPTQRLFDAEKIRYDITSCFRRASFRGLARRDL